MLAGVQGYRAEQPYMANALPYDKQESAYKRRIWNPIDRTLTKSYEIFKKTNLGLNIDKVIECFVRRMFKALKL
jgi:hypothetical protein